MKRFPIATTIIILANLTIFYYMMKAAPFRNWNEDFMISWGANIAYLTVHGQPWRIFAAMFIHGGVIHITGNMLCLLLFGVVVEDEIGPWRFATFYLLCGLAAECASILVSPGFYSFGASGAIAGVFGMLCVLFLRGRREAGALFILQFIVLSFMINASDFHIAWEEHLTGWILGIILMFSAAPASRERVRITG